MIDVVLVLDDKNVMQSCIRAKRWQEVIDCHEYIKADATKIFEFATNNGFYCPTIKRYGSYGVMITWQEEDCTLTFFLDGINITYDLTTDKFKKCGTCVVLEKVNLIFKGLAKNGI